MVIMAEERADYFDDPVSGAARREMRIGSRSLYAISDGYLIMRPQMLGAPGNRTAGYDALAAQYGVPRLPLGCFFFPGPKNTLVDTGLGPLDFGGEGRLVGGRLLEALARLGVAPEQVDILALSHLHADHSGNIGDVNTGEPTFPNAQVFIGRADWEYFIDQQAASVPLAPHITSALRDLDRQGRIVRMDGDLEIASGVRRLDAPGHTPGHSFYSVHDGAERVLLLGDAMYCPQQLTELDWSVSFDVDPELARRTRQSAQRQARADGSSALASHFPELTVARPDLTGTVIYDS